MSVNITILAANRPRLLKQTLDSLGDLSDAVVTIRDAGMNEEVKKVAQQWASAEDRCQKARVFCSSLVTGTGEARNQVIESNAFSYGRGSHLYLSDDDAFFLRPDWLSILTTTYETAYSLGFLVLGAYNHPYHLPVDIIRAGEGIVVQEVQALALQSMLMRWEVWDEFGPFRETTPGKVCDGEDVDFGNKIHAAGGKLGVIFPPLLVNCGVTNSFGQPIPGADMVRAQAPEGVIAE